MPEPGPKATDPLAELAAKAALAQGREAAKRAAERAADRADEALGGAGRSPKARRYKVLALVLLALFLTIGVVGLVLHYWAWFLGAGVLGVAALVAYVWARSRLRARREARGAREAAAEPEARAATAREGAAPRGEKAPAKGAHATTSAPPAESGRSEQRERALREAREAEHEADREARAEAEHERAEAEERAAREIDEELARMRARLRR
jgi:hypothetical protein